MRALIGAFLTMTLLSAIPLGAQAVAVSSPDQIPLAGREHVVTDLSQNRVGITVNYDGTEIIVFGAVARETVPPPGRLDVILTIEGPPRPVTVRHKEKVAGIWINGEGVTMENAPSFYAVAATAPLAEILSPEADARYHITLPEILRPTEARLAQDQAVFAEALQRLREARGIYSIEKTGVTLREGVLIRSDVVLPANLTEGSFRARIFLVRAGQVVSVDESAIEVHKQGLERFLHRLALDQPLVYGILSLGLAILAGWLASALFGWIYRR